MKKSMNWLVLSLVLIISMLSGTPFAAAQEQSLEVLKRELEKAQKWVDYQEVWIPCQEDIRLRETGYQVEIGWLKRQIDLQHQMLLMADVATVESIRVVHRRELETLHSVHQRELESLREHHQRQLEDLRSELATARRTPLEQAGPPAIQNNSTTIEASKSPDVPPQETPSGEFPWGIVGGVILLLLLALAGFLVWKYRPALMEWWQERQQRKAAEALEASRLKAIAAVRKLYQDSRQLALQAEVITKKAEKDATQLRSDADANMGDDDMEDAAEKAEAILARVNRIDGQLIRKLSDIEDAKAACDVSTIDVKDAALALEKADKTFETARKLFLDLQQAANPPATPPTP